MFFLMPALLLCLQSNFVNFTLLQMIFNANNKNSSFLIRNIKFYIIIIGALLLTYPVLSFVNLDTLFLLLLPFFIVLQLYAYAADNHTP